MNVIVEKSVKAYETRMKQWVDIALEEGIRFFVTSLGNPSWVVKRAHAYGGLVYHDITERKWAMRALDANVDGLICVNNRAGGQDIEFLLLSETDPEISAGSKSRFFMPAEQQ